MSIPLDKLYDFLDNCINHDLIIYRFLPHGSKNLKDLLPYKDYVDQFELHTTPMAIFHDQEPLHFDLYSLDVLLDTYRWYQPSSDLKLDFDQPDQEILDLVWDMHIRGVGTTAMSNIYDKTILVHSEQNSQDVIKFQQQGYLPVYYWSHALIARDWFRFARHDCSLDHQVPTKDFLIYNRSWSGSREYRLKFAELLLEHGLVENCVTSFNAWCDHKHYTDHVWENPALAVQTQNLEQTYQSNTWQSWASADYQSHDYSLTRLEIVLETVFDDQRWHLTEKILRPIACGKPFMLLSTPGSLAFLRSYGFETFHELWNEDYDLMSDPVSRMLAVIDNMKRIATMDSNKKSQMFAKVKNICDRNKAWFFGDQFFDLVAGEYITNMTTACETMQNHRNGTYFKRYCRYLHKNKKTLWPDFMSRDLAKRLWITLKT
jgi:hypothetical protein